MRVNKKIEKHFFIEGVIQLIIQLPLLPIYSTPINQPLVNESVCSTLTAELRKKHVEEYIESLYEYSEKMAKRSKTHRRQRRKVDFKVEQKREMDTFEAKKKAEKELEEEKKTRDWEAWWASIP